MEIPKFLQVSPELVKYCQTKFDYGGFYGRNDAHKMINMYAPNAASMSPKFQDGSSNVLNVPNSPTWNLPNTNPNYLPPTEDMPQYSYDPSQSTAPITTNDIAPSDGQGNFKNQNPTQDSWLHNAIAGTNKAAGAAMNFLDLTSQFSPNSYENAPLQFNRSQDKPTNYLNEVGQRHGDAYAKNGGKLPLRFQKSTSSFNEGDEADLTTEQIHQLEQQGYKFQIL